jgi:hypothetical protein
VSAADLVAVMVLLEAGHSWAQIRNKPDYNDAFISRWSKRFARERPAGLFSRRVGRCPSMRARFQSELLLDIDFDYYLNRSSAERSRFPMPLTRSTVRNASRPLDGFRLR